MPSKSEVFVLGGYQTDFARNWSKEGKHLVAMMREAVEGALLETRVDAADIEAAYVANFAAELYNNQGLLNALFVECSPHFVGLPTMRVEAACASGTAAALAAMAAIQAGHYDVVCVVGVEQMKTVNATDGSRILGTAAWYEREAKGVDFPFPKLFGRLADAYEARFGLDSTHLAAIADKNYRNAKLNPNAQTRSWYMSREHASTAGKYNPPMFGHLKVSDCSQITDGGVCVVMASATYAARYAAARGLDAQQLPRLLGWGHTTAPLQFNDKLNASAGQPYVLPQTRKAIADALQRANLADCWELDAVETHDCFTSSEYMAIDHFGLTAPGCSWQALEDGVTELGGRLPFNPSGGLIGAGHPVGATGVRQLLDATLQVSGKAGAYQVEGARRVGILNIGGSATTNVALVVGR